MNLLTLIQGEKIQSNGEKRIPKETFSTLIEAEQILKKLKEQENTYRHQVAKECEIEKEQATQEGFEAGLVQWTKQIAYMEKEIQVVKEEMEQTIVSLAMTAIKKIIGKVLDEKPDTIVDIVATALKSVSQHHRISIFVNQNDLGLLEEQRPRLKSIFEHLQTLQIIARDDVEPGGCVIETESGIINARLENQLKALEGAFQGLFKDKKGSSS